MPERGVEVGVRRFRSQLRHWLERVRRGEEIVVTDRGTPVARVVRAGTTTTLERLVAEGVVTPAREPKKPSRTYRSVRPRGSVSDILIAQRRSRPY